MARCHARSTIPASPASVPNASFAPSALQASADQLAVAVATHSDTVTDLLAARLQAFEQMFSTGGAELTEQEVRSLRGMVSSLTRTHLKKKGKAPE